jgi:uncharacterized protein with HEPN domain
MTRPDDDARLRHMLDASRRAIGMPQGRRREDLDQNDMLGLSLVRRLEIIGEAAKGVSAQMRRAHPQIPWKQMAGTRDRLTHAYFDVDLNVVWSIVTEDLPPLVRELEATLGPDKGESR